MTERGESNDKEGIVKLCFPSLSGKSCGFRCRSTAHRQDCTAAWG